MPSAQHPARNWRACCAGITRRACIVNCAGCMRSFSSIDMFEVLVAAHRIANPGNVCCLPLPNLSAIMMMIYSLPNLAISSALFEEKCEIQSFPFLWRCVGAPNVVHSRLANKANRKLNRRSLRRGQRLAAGARFAELRFTDAPRHLADIRRRLRACCFGRN